jgi:hypothetical protein
MLLGSARSARTSELAPHPARHAARAATMPD